MKFIQLINEGIDIDFIKTNIQKAVKEDPKRLGHGHTGKTGFWILPDGKILPHSKGFKEAYKVKNVINVHSHSGAEGYNDSSRKLDCFSGGDIAVLRHMLRYGYGDTIVVISREGEMMIIKGGNWKKEDETFERKLTKERSEENYLELLKNISKKRNALFIINKKWK